MWTAAALARGRKSLCLLPPSQFQRLRLLRLVLVLVADVHLQLLAHGAAQLALGQHSQDRFLHHLVRTPVKALAELLFAQTAREAGVMPIHLLLGLHAGNADL